MAFLNARTQTGYTELDDVITAKDSFLMNPDLRVMVMTLSHLQFKNDEKYRCLLNAALTCKDFLEVVRIMGRIGSFGDSTETVARSAA